MSHEISQTVLESAWKILEAEGSLYFGEKRNLVIPKPDLIKTLKIVGLTNTVVAYNAFGIFINYLNGQPIIDRFGSDHDARRNWRTEMERKVGLDLFNALYRDRNQLRLNKMNVIFGGLYRLKNLVKKNSPTAQRLTEIDDGLAKLFYDDPSNPTRSTYNQKTIEEKLLIVRAVEDECLETLRLFAK